MEWLLSHKYPFIICYIDKKNSSVEIFQTLVLSSCFFNEKISSITLSMETSANIFEIDQKEGDLKISLGPAILKFKLSKLENQKWTVQTKNILKSWIELDQENINQKSMGVNLIRVPEKYHTNSPLKEAKSFKGNFKLNADHQSKFYDIFFRMLSQIVNQVASEKDISKFKVVSDFSGQFTSNSSIKDSWGIKLLANAVNTGAKYCGLNNRILIKKEDGTSEILMSDIEN